MRRCGRQGWANLSFFHSSFYATLTRLGLEGCRSRHVIPLGLVLCRVLLDTSPHADTVSGEARSSGMALFFLLRV